MAELEPGKKSNATPVASSGTARAASSKRQAVGEEARWIEAARKARAARLRDLEGHERKREGAGHDMQPDGQRGRAFVPQRDRVEPQPGRHRHDQQRQREQPETRARTAHPPGAGALDAHAAPLVDLRVRELGRRLVRHHGGEAAQERHRHDGRDDVRDVEEDELHRGAPLSAGR